MARERRMQIVQMPEPVWIGDVEATEVEMREPLVRDMLDAQVAADVACAAQGRRATQAEIEVRLFGLLCRVTVEDLLDWPQSAYAALQEAYVFLAAPPPTTHREKKKS